MAWWNDILLTRDYLGNYGYSEAKKPSAVFSRAVLDYFHEHFTDVVYRFFNTFIYSYLTLSVVTFFFSEHVPPAFSFIIEALSEPYLGAVGVYLLLREVGRRRTKEGTKPKDYFILFWFIFFVGATVFTYYVPSTPLVSELYKIVVTNSFAAIILRISVLIK